MLFPEIATAPKKNPPEKFFCNNEMHKKARKKSWEVALTCYAGIGAGIGILILLKSLLAIRFIHAYACREYTCFVCAAVDSLSTILQCFQGFTT